MEAAFATGNCGALAGDATRLAQTRAALVAHGKRARLLPERISKDPLAAAVRDDDPQWAAIVSWVMEALVQAEESGVKQVNVKMCAHSPPAIRCFVFCSAHPTRSAPRSASTRTGSYA